MPVFSKMMGSYPFNLIRGLGYSSVARSVGMGAGIGAALGTTDRRRSLAGGMARGAMLGGIGAGIGLGIGKYGGGISTFARNMSRPGIAGMYGRSAMSSARSAYGGAKTTLGTIASRMPWM